MISFGFSATFIFSQEALTDAAYSRLILSPSLCRWACISFSVVPSLGGSCKGCIWLLYEKGWAGLSLWGEPPSQHPPPPHASPLNAIQVSPSAAKRSALCPSLAGYLPWLCLGGTAGCARARKEEESVQSDGVTISSLGTHTGGGADS